MRKPLFALLGLVSIVGISAMAADFNPPPRDRDPSFSPRTRAEVKAETLRAIEAGEVTFGDVATPVLSEQRATTHMEARVETQRALAAGDVVEGEEADPPPVRYAGVGKTRAEVKEEVRSAIAAHELSFSDDSYPERGFVTVPRPRKAPASAITAARGPAVLNRP